MKVIARVFRRAAADRHEHRLAGGADPVEAAGLGPVSGPGEQAAGVELAVGRMKPPAHHAGRERRNRQGAHPSLHLAADDLVRHHEDLAVAVREVEQRPPQRRPGRVVLSTQTNSAGDRSKALVIQQTGCSIASSDGSVTL